VAKGPSWASSSGVGFIPGDGRPTPGDMTRMAEEQAELDRLAAKNNTTQFIAKSDVPEVNIKGIKLTYSTNPTKADK
jgi:hypothetical protein